MSDRDREVVLEELQEIKYVGASVAEQLYDELSIRTVEDVVEAGREDWLRSLKGIGEDKQGYILQSAESILDERGVSLDADEEDESDADPAEAGDDESDGSGTVEVTTVDRATPEETDEESTDQDRRDGEDSDDTSTEESATVDVAEEVAEQIAAEAEAAADELEEEEDEDDDTPAVGDAATGSDDDIDEPDETESTGESVEDFDESTTTEEADGPDAAGSTEDRPRPRIERFIDRVRCPACGHDSFDRTQSALTCTACRREYDLHDGIADLAPPRENRPNLVQFVMESNLYARIYEKIARPNLTKLVSDRSMDEERELAAEYLELDTESTVLDVACGTGNFTRHFAEDIAARSTGYADRSLVVGMDLSWPMLDHARTYLRRYGLTDRVYLLHADATRIPIGRSTFDRLHCAGSLHLMDDIDEALRNFARVLERDGICVIGTFLLEGSLPTRLAKRFAEFPTNFHWFERSELQERLERAGFDVVAESISGEAITVKARRT